eukprot:3941869-Rhodomonas_salina.3
MGTRVLKDMRLAHLRACYMRLHCCGSVSHGLLLCICYIVLSIQEGMCISFLQCNHDPCQRNREYMNTCNKPRGSLSYKSVCQPHAPPRLCGPRLTAAPAATIRTHHPDTLARCVAELC